VTSGKPSTTPPSELVLLLRKHGLSWAEFQKKGRPPPGVVAKRQAIVTEIHMTGMPWVEMCRVTGLSVGAINRLTRAVGNAASLENRRANAARTGSAGKGARKPWLSEQLSADWASGKFDFHRGRIRSVAERESLRLAAARPEVRQQRRESALRRWQKPEERAQLLAFHRSVEERLKRSEAQTERMHREPSKWLRGIGAWVYPKKCSRSPIWTRSSYERVVVDLLERDASVTSYAFEPKVQLPSGRWILPDFVVYFGDGLITLIEVKASWVLGLPPEHKVQIRLRAACSYAESMGWEFMVWTEKDFSRA